MTAVAQDTMTAAPESLQPRDEADLVAAVQWAAANKKTFEVIGGGSKRAIGRAAQWDATLDLSQFRGITLYEPAELVLSAKAATPMHEIETALAQARQELAFEPIDYGPLLGRPTGQGTLGGVIAANLAGPRRIKAGAARDHFLGFRAVSGRGEAFKAGGRVVKNVTGYDLSKLLAGSWGTLAAMTDVTVKVLPRAETEETVLVHGLADADAIRALAAAMGSAGEVAGAAHLPAAATAHLPERVARGAVTALRLEGVPPSIRHRRTLLEALLASYGQVSVLPEAESRALWRAVRNVTPFAASDRNDARPVWRISTTPSEGAAVVARIAAQAQAETIYDWAGGLIWLRLAASDDAGATIVRTALRDAGGHATLIRAPAAVRASVLVFEPQDAATTALTKRIKEGFDPKGVLNPGRMYPGV
ncbi:MAG: glycolate oxidase binding subunit [Variibacter sp.]|nr:glycolate oxidase binding subunit [Variibacter sp.]